MLERETLLKYTFAIAFMIGQLLSAENIYTKENPSPTVSNAPQEAQRMQSQVKPEGCKLHHNTSVFPFFLSRSSMVPGVAFGPLIAYFLNRNAPRNLDQPEGYKLYQNTSVFPVFFPRSSMIPGMTFRPLIAYFSNRNAPQNLDHYFVKIRESLAFCFPIIK